jgi:hypothetical protein
VFRALFSSITFVPTATRSTSRLWIVKQACNDYMVSYYASLGCWAQKRTEETQVNAVPGSCPENNDKAPLCENTKAAGFDAPGASRG